MDTIDERGVIIGDPDYRRGPPTGTGSPARKLDDRSVDELRKRARKLGIEGRSSMTKSELIAAIRKSG